VRQRKHAGLMGISTMSALYVVNLNMKRYHALVIKLRGPMTRHLQQIIRMVVCMTYVLCAAVG